MPLHAIPGWLLTIHQAAVAPGVLEAPEQCRQMTEAGHPLAGTYQKVLAFYESLPYLASRDSRFYTARDPHNYCLVFPPTLTIDYPAGEQDLSTALAQHTGDHWQQTQCYGLDYGGWALLSTDDQLVREAQTHGMTIYSQLKNGPTALLLMGCNEMQFHAIARLIDRCHAGFHLGSQWSQTMTGKIQEKLQDDLHSLDIRQDAWL